MLQDRATIPKPGQMIPGRLLAEGQLRVLCQLESSLEFRSSREHLLLQFTLALDQVANANAVPGDDDDQQNKSADALEPACLPEVRLHHNRQSRYVGVPRMGFVCTLYLKEIVPWRQFCVESLAPVPDLDPVCVR